MIYQGQELEKIAALTDERDALKAETSQLRELMNVYNLGGWTDSLTLIKERDALQARVQTLQSRVDYLEAWKAEAMNGKPAPIDGFGGNIDSAFEAVTAERLSTLDCRTCRQHATATGGCISVLKCIEGSAYQRAGFRQCWEKA